MRTDHFELLAGDANGSEKSVGILSCVRPGEQIPNWRMLGRRVHEEVEDENAPV